jgi:hypothetical protein
MLWLAAKARANARVRSASSPSSPPKAARQQHVVGAQTRPSLEGKTVVIADDDPIIVEYLELRCRHLGMQVETAYDGLKAVLKVGKTRPSISICHTSRASG